MAQIRHMPLVLVGVLDVAAFSISLAQDANVIQLTDAESQQAQSIAAAQHKLDQRKEALREEIVRNHLEAPQSQTNGCVVDRMLVRPEWGCAEYVFSSDNKFIVPSSHLTSAPSWGTQTYELVNGVATGIDPEK